VNALQRRLGRSRFANVASVTVLSFAVVAIAGCRSTRPNWSVEEHSHPPLILRLLPGDELNIEFLGAEQLNITQSVRRDGFITLRLVGDVMAAGKTIKELQDEVAELYASQLQTRETTVLVQSTAPVLITGSVMEPGRIPMDRPMTALAAIAEAGGFNAREAEVRSVVVIRHSDGKRSGFLLNLKPALNGRTDDPFFLEPLDIVHVPRTRIVKINQFISQYINGMLPSLGVEYGSAGETTFTR